jgi:uncharacterized ferritin-like protein (DUF455 family)
MDSAAAPDLFTRAAHCLCAAEIEHKLAGVVALKADWDAGRVRLTPEAPAPAPIGEPGRPPRPVLVSPFEVQRRSVHTPEGRAALIHSLAHIEFNAIHLALDAVYRFRGLPREFYADWLQVAAEEALHFSLLREHLRTLGHDYGDFPAHNGLWEMAVKTAHDPLVRMALVPRVLEARGLDVSPALVAKLKSVGDTRAVEILEIILRDEIGHVRIGNRWYAWLCAQRGLDPVATFEQLLREHGAPRLRPPFHEAARRAAGFTDAELKLLNDFAASR